MDILYKITMNNAHRYYSRSNHTLVAELMSEDGFMADIITPERVYHIVTRIMKEAEMLIMDISPEIHCSSPDTISMVIEYANKINAMHLSGNVKVNPNGHVYVQIEQSFKDFQITCEMLEKMETTSILILDTFCGVLEKLSKGRLLDADEVAPETVSEKYKEKIEDEIRKIKEDFLSDSSTIDSLDDPDSYLNECIRTVNKSEKDSDEIESNEELKEKLKKALERMRSREPEIDEEKTIEPQSEEDNILSEIRAGLKTAIEMEMLNLENEEETED